MLTKLFNAVKEHVAQAKEFRRQIDRQKLMIDPGRVVLMDDFDECFGPYSKEKDSNFLQKIRDEKYKDFTRSYIAMAQSGEIKPERYHVPRSLVSERSRQRALDSYQAGLAQLPNVRKKIEERTGEVREPENDEIIKMLKDLVERVENPPSHVDAEPLGTLLEVWDRAVDFSGLETCACWLGQGQIMLDFYKAVNVLDDYGHLFPNRPPPPNNADKDKAREKERSRQAAPELAPGKI